MTYLDGLILALNGIDDPKVMRGLRSLAEQLKGAPTVLHLQPNFPPICLAIAGGVALMMAKHAELPEMSDLGDQMIHAGFMLAKFEVEATQARIPKEQLQ